jgi:hypothetical protein
MHEIIDVPSDVKEFASRLVEAGAKTVRLFVITTTATAHHFP